MAKRKAVSIRDVAERAGVSPTTASLALSGNGNRARISRQTQESILKTAKQMGYVPRTTTKSPVRQVPLIGVFWPSDSPNSGLERFCTELSRYAKAASSAFEFVVQPFSLRHLEDKRERISSSCYDGAIFSGLSDQDIQFLDDTQLDIPIVLYNRSSKQYLSVISDEYETGSIPARCFYERGHKTVGYVAPDAYSKSLSLRRSGFVDTFKELGGSTPVGIENSGNEGYDATAELLASDTPPTAIFCLDDSMVFGILRCIKERGLTAPDDIELISSGDRIWCSYTSPTITSLSPPVSAMVADCVELLLKAITDPGLLPGMERSYNLQIVYRESCQAPGPDEEKR